MSDQSFEDTVYEAVDRVANRHAGLAPQLAGVWSIWVVREWLQVMKDNGLSCIHDTVEVSE